MTAIFSKKCNQTNSENKGHLAFKIYCKQKENIDMFVVRKTKEKGYCNSTI